MTPDLKARIEQSIREWGALGYERQEIIQAVTGEEKVSRDEVAAVYDDISSAGPAVESEPQIIAGAQPIVPVNNLAGNIVEPRQVEPLTAVAVAELSEEQQDEIDEEIKARMLALARDGHTNDQIVDTINDEYDGLDEEFFNAALSEIWELVCELDANSIPVEPGLIPSVKAAIGRGFHVFALTPKDKIPLPGSQGFKDSKSPLDALALAPWNQDPNRNIGIDLGASDLCVLDFDKPENIPAWLNETKTYKVRTAKGVHVYFRGARKTTKLYVDGNLVGDVKSQGGYVLAAGSIHPSGAVYTVVDESEILPTPGRVSELLKHEEKTPVNVSQDGPPIPYGSHDTELTRIAGLLRNASMNVQDIEEHLIQVCERRCEGYGSDYREMCKKIAHSIGKKPVGQAAPPVVFNGYDKAADSASDWRGQFRNLSEMEQGEIVMIIDRVLQEGTCFIGANPGHGKTLVALAFAKAISLGEPLFGIPEYTVKEPRNVVYLIPESGDKAFRGRGESFRLPTDDRFLARTISSGASLALSDPALMEAVRQKKPVVILDTASRFLQANDENSAAQNRLLVNDVLALRAAGAACVIILHHAKKSQGEKREAMTLDNMLRGTSDFGAMCDQAYGIRMDEHLYNRGAGPMEIELVNLKDRERLGGLTSIRLAASYKRPGSIFPASYIDETGDFRPVEYKETKARDEATLNSLVEANQMMTVTELCEATGMKPYTVKETLKRFGWHMAKGGPDGHSPWHKDTSGVCPYKPGKKSAVRQSQADVNFDAPARVN